MKNKFRRSMTSVLLAASLLFSSQSVIAFADYESKSDASDLSPVQESVEPVIGESTEAPVAAPMMARVNAPVAYSAPEVSGYSLYRYYNYFNEPEPDTVSVYITDGVENYGTVYESAYEIGGFDAFTSGSSWQSYTIDANSFKNNDWIFKGWSYKLTQNNDNHDLGNITDNAVGKRYTFGDGRNSVDAWCHQYNGGETISIHALWRTGLLGSHIEEKSTLHHSIYANFNPLVTVDVGENGKVTYNGTVVDKDTTDKKVEVEYGTAPDFTITPDTGYKVASVTFGDTTIQANEDGTYTLPSVTEPTTLEVTFEPDIESNKPNPGVNMDEVILTVKCATCGKIYRYNLTLEGTEGIDGDYYIDYVSGQNKAEISINNQKWLNKFDSTGNHILNDERYSVLELSLNDDDKWTIDNNEDSEKTTIHVKCTSEIPEPLTPDVTDLDNLFLEGVTVKCSEKDNHTKSYHFKDISADNYNNAFYTVTKPKLQDGGKYLSVLTVKNQAYVDRYNTSTFLEEPHKLNDENEQTFNLVWDGIKWSCEESTSIGISVTCGIPDPKPSDLAGVQVKLECVNDATHNQTIGFDWLSSEDYYTVTRDENDPTKATVSISEQQSINWVNNSNTVGKPQHVLYSAANNSISLTYKDEKWELDYPNNVFCIKVLCPPTDLIMDKLNVSVQCAEKADHELQTFDMIADTFTATVKQNTDNEYVCELTVNSEKYVELYNSRHPGHVPAAPATVVPLKYTGSAWEVIVGKETIPFVVSCEAPDAPTTDEVSMMGKLLTLDCITENVNHSDVSYNLDRGTFTVGEVYTQNTIMPLSDNTTVPAATYHVNVTVNRTSYYLNQYNNVYGTHTLAAGNPVEPIVVLEYNGTEWTPINNARLEVEHEVTTPGGGGEGTNPGGNGGDNDDDDDRYTGGNTVTRTINDDDVPLNDRPTNTTTIDDEDVPLADLPDDTVTIDDGEVPLKANPSTGDSLPFAAMAAAALSLGGVIVLNRKKK